MAQLIRLPRLPSVTPRLPLKGNRISSTIPWGYPLYIYKVTFLNEYIYKKKSIFNGIINSLYIYFHKKR